MHQRERLRDAAALRERAMVAQEHHRLAAEVCNELLLLGRAQPRPVIVVVADLAAIGDGKLVDREQPHLLRRHGGAADRMQMHHRLCRWHRLVHHAVHDPSCRVERPAAARDIVALDVDLHEVGRRHLLEQHAERDEQKAPVAARDARREVGIDQVIHIAPGEDSVAGREFATRLQLRLVRTGEFDSSRLLRSNVHGECPGIDWVRT